MIRHIIEMASENIFILLSEVFKKIRYYSLIIPIHIL